MTQEYVLFAWGDEPQGGLDDCCGKFTSIEAAVEFFETSDHCSYFDFYQIVDSITWEIVQEGTSGV